MTKKLTILLALLAMVLFAQPATTITRMFYSGSTLQYVCTAPATVAATTASVAGGGVTNIVVASNVGTITMPSHYLYPGAVIIVSGSSTTAINATYTVQTAPDNNTLTVNTSGVADGTYTTGIVVSTSYPLYSTATWFVTVMRYNGANLEGVSPGGGTLSLAYRAKCSDRANY